MELKRHSERLLAQVSVTYLQSPVVQNISSRCSKCKAAMGSQVMGDHLVAMRLRALGVDMADMEEANMEVVKALEAMEVDRQDMAVAVDLLQRP